MLNGIKRRLAGLVHAYMPMRHHHLHGINPLSDPNDPLVHETFTRLMTADHPSFIGRLGGTDFEAAKFYWARKGSYVSSGVCATQMEAVQEYSGYFDFDHSEQRFISFLELLAESCATADALTYAGPPLRVKFDTNRFDKVDLPLLRHVCRDKPLMRYTFIETVRPFLESFRTWGEGRTLLVVSPLSRSVRSQAERLDDLIPGYRFPSFDLITADAPVTYSKMSDTKESLGVTTQNWFEELAKLQDYVSQLDFDIAWLSCGSYANPLGSFIRHQLGRHAIYVGGVLNPIFNIYGERYDVPHYRSVSNPATQVNPIENSDVAHLQAGRDKPSEALRAYFGERSAED